MCSRLRVHNNHSLCPTIPKIADLICSFHQDSSHQKVASICIYHELTLYVKYTKNQTVIKWIPFELIWEVYLEYIVTIHFVRPYSSLLTWYVQYTKTLAVKKWLPFALICAVYIVTLNSWPCRNLVQIWMCQKIKFTLPGIALLGWAACIIILHHWLKSYSDFAKLGGGVASGKVFFIRGYLTSF